MTPLSADDPRTVAPRTRSARAQARAEATRTRWRRFAWAVASLLVLMVIVAALLPQRPLDPPMIAPANWFTDNAGLVSQTFAANMNLRLPIEQRAQIAVLVDPGKPEDVEGFTSRSAQDWHIGSKSLDNGIVLFVFPAIHTVRLEVGYGLEAALPDVDAKHLVETTLVPQFAAGRYEDGIYDCLEALFHWLADDAHQAKAHAVEAGFGDSVVAATRQLVRFAKQGFAIFRAAELKLRIVLGLAAVLFVGAVTPWVFGAFYALAGIVQLPWRLTHCESFRNLDGAKLAREFALPEFLKRPPPSIMAIVDELGLAGIWYGLICLATIVGAILLIVGSNVLVGGHGQFGGAGVTLLWPLVQ